MDVDKLSLPSGWQVKAIQDVYTFTKKPSTLKLDGYKQIPFIPMELVPLGRIFADNWNWKNTKELGSGTYFENGDLLVAKITPSFENGKQAIGKIEMPFGYATTEVIPIQEIEGISDKFYLHFVLLHPEIRKELAGKMDGSTGRQRLRKETLASKRIPLPPLAEQRRIAYVLTTVQTAIEQQTKLIELTRELKSALMKKLFTEGLRGEKQKETEIGLVPESWEIVELKSILREPLRNGHSAKASLNGKGIRTLTLTAVTRRDFSEKNTKITSADPERVKNFWLKSGDILVERANTPEYVGLAALYSGNDDFAVFPDLMIRVRVDEQKAIPYFIAEYLITPVCRTYFQKSMHSTAGNFPKIDQPTIEKTLIPLPKLDEQTEIVHVFETLDKKINLSESRLSKLEELFRTLLHQLMTGNVRTTDLRGLVDVADGDGADGQNQ